MSRIAIAPSQVVFLQRGVQAGSGLITLLLVVRCLSAEEQGYYYAIGSLLSGYALFDLGLANLLVHVSARLFPGLAFSAQGSLLPQGDRRAHFVAMVAWSRRWFRSLAWLSLILLPVGIIYFEWARAGLQTTVWLWPWVLVCLALALSTTGYPFLSVIEGSGRVTEVYWVRIAHFTLGSVLSWILLLTGFGLYAPAMAPLGVGMVLAIWLRLRYPDLLAASLEMRAFDWRSEVLPLQKKVAISCLGNYLLLFLPTLIVFYRADAAQAGRLGLSIVVVNLLGVLCGSRLSAKLPQIAQLVISDGPLVARRLFLREFRRALLAMVAINGALCGLVALFAGQSLAMRILSPGELLLLCVSFIAYHAIGMISVYLRARGEELIAGWSLVATIVALLIASAFANRWGVDAVLCALLVVYLPIVVLTGIRSWRSFHRAELESRSVREPSADDENIIELSRPHRVSVSIVSHGQRALIAPLLADIARLCGGPLQVIITLNIPEADPDRPAHFPHELLIVRNATPKGFGANHNAAFAAATGAHFCVLNPDVRFTEDPFPVLIERLVDASAGVIAPRVVDSDGVEQDSVRRFPTFISLARKAWTRERKTDHRATHSGLQYPDWVAGMFMLFRSGHYREMGGFDERYFLYYEDVDLCLRVHRAGLRVLYEPAITIIHDSQRASWKKPRYAIVHLASMARYLVRRHVG